MSEPSSALVDRMVQTAAAFLASLDREQQEKTRFPFPGEPERRRWYYAPTERGGLPLAEMTAPQQLLAHQFIASGLSAGGYATTAIIMGLENVLAALEGWQTTGGYPGRGLSSRGRDPLLYFVSVFGEPGSDAWGWRLGGHHLCLHYTIVAGELASPTPCFFGADPAEQQLVGASVLRPLAGEEDLGRALLQALDAEQRVTAIIAPVAPSDLVQQNRVVVTPGAPPRPPQELFDGRASPERLPFLERLQDQQRQELELHAEYLDALRYETQAKGLAAAQMRSEQQSLLRQLLRQYLDRMPEEVAQGEAAKFSGERLQAVHFAWAGSSERRQPHYYRVQGPRLLIEYDNMQRDANHIHAAWRDPDGDFGMDVLAEHYAQAH